MAAATNSSQMLMGLTFEHTPFIAHDTYEGRRLITNVTAKKSDGSLFWKSAFYRSTGSNSKVSGVWLPFLGISNMKRQSMSGNGKPITISKEYYSKSVGLPDGWPADDKYVIKDEEMKFKYLSEIEEIGRDLMNRVMTRSFLLASNSLEAIGETPEARDERILALRAYIKSTPVDEAIFARLAENTNFNPHKGFYNTEVLPASTSMEVNTYIGDNLYFNNFIETKLNLSTFKNSLPNYYSNVASKLSYFGFGGSRRRRRGKSLKRKSLRRRR